MSWKRGIGIALLVAGVGLVFVRAEAAIICLFLGFIGTFVQGL